ncbi:hypothetical protein Tco_1490385 [Tanacetum coccineum]
MSAHDDFSLHDDEELSLHDDASLAGSQPASNKGDAPAKPPQIITTNTLSNIKLPVLQKKLIMILGPSEMDHYLEYIDNEVWISDSEWELKDESHQRKGSENLLYGCFQKSISGSFFIGWMMPRFEAFTISSKESLEKGYDRFQKLLSQLDALGASVSDEDANHKFLRSLPPAWDSLAMTMRTKKNIDTLSIDDLYINSECF